MRWRSTSGHAHGGDVGRICESPGLPSGGALWRMVQTMIEITSESDNEVIFSNTRSDLVFRAESRDHGEVWHVYREGSTDRWGRAENRGKYWYGYAGNLRATQPYSVASRNEAFEWITNDTGTD